MKSLSALLLPAALAAVVATTAPGIDAGKPKGKDLNIPPYTWEYVPSVDTVLYPKDAYKLRRIGNFDEIQIKDSTSGTADSLLFADDTIPRLSARDTIKVPDSLRLTDPFRYRYYVALLDSLTHVQVRDSLKKSQMSHLANADTLLSPLSSLLSPLTLTPSASPTSPHPSPHHSTCPAPGRKYRRG